MKFGEAITLLNAGHPVTRQGWNGKGMFLIRAGGYSVPAEDARPNGIITKEFLKRRGLTHLEILPHIDMWTINAGGRQAYLPGWLLEPHQQIHRTLLINTLIEIHEFVLHPTGIHQENARCP
jgi:hypothetical protein